MANQPLSVVTRYLQDLREIQGLSETPDALLLDTSPSSMRKLPSPFSCDGTGRWC